MHLKPLKEGLHMEARYILAKERDLSIRMKHIIIGAKLAPLRLVFHAKFKR